MIILRRFKSSDLEAVLQVYYEAIHTTGANYYDKEQVQVWASVDDLEKSNWLQSLTDNITYVAEVDNRIVGFGDMTHTGYIDRFFILKNYQGQGILPRIMKKFEEEAHKLNLKELTTEASIVAMPVARRQGFEIVSKQLKMYKGKEFINYVMCKKLKNNDLNNKT